MTDINQPTITVQLEFLDADVHRPDPARVGEVGRTVVGTLRQNGYAVQPTYTGERGGTVYEMVFHLAQTIHDNQEWLKSLAELAIPLATLWAIVRKTRTETEKKPVSHPHITITIDNRSITLQEADVESEQALLERLLQEDLPTMLSPQSTVTVTTRVPPEPPIDL